MLLTTDNKSILTKKLITIPYYMKTTEKKSCFLPFSNIPIEFVNISSSSECVHNVVFFRLVVPADHVASRIYKKNSQNKTVKNSAHVQRHDCLLSVNIGYSLKIWENIRSLEQIELIASPN